MNNYLMHVGNENSGRYPRGSGERPFQRRNEAKRAERERKQDLKNRRTLTDEELQKRIDRLNLEKKYADLAKADLNPGKAEAKRILSESGSKALKTVAAGAAVYIGKTVLMAAADKYLNKADFKSSFKNSFDIKDFGSSLFNGGAKKK